MTKRNKWRISLLIIAPLIYLLGEFISSLAWNNPDYHYLTNWISDLGVPIITKMINSPWHNIMNTGFITYGILAFLAFYLLQKVFYKRRRVVLSFAFIQSLGIILVGLFPGYPWWGIVFHGLGALMAIVGGNLCLIFASHAIKQAPSKKSFVRFSNFLGIIGIVSFILCLSLSTVFTYDAVFERLSVYTIMLWDIIFAGYLLRTKPFVHEI